MYDYVLRNTDPVREHRLKVKAEWRVGERQTPVSVVRYGRGQ